MLKFKDKVYSIAFQVNIYFLMKTYNSVFCVLFFTATSFEQPGGGGVRLLALKFVEAVILLYTPDPNGSLKPPSDEGNEFHQSFSDFANKTDIPFDIPFYFHQRCFIYLFLYRRKSCRI